MAIFNTIAGGYYGKLGVTVGQRWKNLRTVRSYVIPANPRTEKQQANRGKFSQCIPFAQVAQMMNPKTKAFDTSTMTLWNRRMSLARTLQRDEASELDRLPLYPKDFSVPNVIQSYTWTEILSPTEIVVTADFTEEQPNRVLVLCLTHDLDAFLQGDFILGIGETDAEAPNSITFRLNREIDGSFEGYGRIVSCDETDPQTQLIGGASEFFYYQGE